MVRTDFFGSSVVGAWCAEEGVEKVTDLVGAGRAD